MKEFIGQGGYYWPELAKSLAETGTMMLISWLAAIFFGLPLGTVIYLARKNKQTKFSAVSLIVNGFVDLVRSFPFLLFVVALIPLTRSLFGTAFGYLAASFPLAIVSVVVYARLVEQVLLDVPSETLELARSFGSTTIQYIFFFLYVEARSGLVLGLTTVMIGMLSYSTVMGVVGGGGIGDFAIRFGYQRYEYTVMYTAVLLMLFFVTIIQRIGNEIAKRINKK